MSQGYIKLHRKLQECWIWDSDEPFDRRSAWIDILISANHSDNKMLFDGSLILIKRGQFITSIRKLSTKWKWSSTKVTAFLDTLEKDQMIKRESDTKKTLISVINYGLYQDNTSEKKTPKKQTEDTEVTQKNTNKNEEECIKNDKETIYANCFEEVWSHYPRKEDKGLAYKCYLARIHDGYSEEELLHATIGYEKECKDSNREKKYIKKGATFYGVNTPFVDFLQKEDKEFQHQIFNLDLQETPPYFGFPEKWFKGNELDESKVVSVIRPVVLSMGWYREEEVSKNELIELFKSRRRYYENHCK
jgi:hypothetical protein